ncbi:hypothetical protein [Aureimonas sp. D3]|uniref:hypothetical protein n=1 Tax=Aureimonas sp. D3 TaxID=1638164 RepID=UPI00078240BA|nr:hypothetical protein [Aureimonas sp. D3]
MGRRTYFDPKRQKSADRMERRKAEAIDPEAGRCSLFGCSRPVQRADGKGFSRTHCHYHVQFKQRHGSYWKETYSAAHLLPYRKAADRFLIYRWRQKDTERALFALRDLMNWEGRNIPLPDLKTRSPDLKVKAALWRLNAAQVKPLQLLRDHLAISGAVHDDFAGDDEFRLVQIAKAASRLASGWRKQYDAAPAWVLNQRSAGIFLRGLGGKLEEACGFYTAEHLKGMLTVKREEFDAVALRSHASIA